MLGLSNVPRAGDTFFVTADERTARQIAEKREAADRNAALAKRRKRISLEDFDQAVAEGKIDTLNLILKGDVSGAVEALEDSLLKIDVGEGVQLRVIHRGVGAITQNDVNLATVDNADHHRLQRQARRARCRTGRPRRRGHALLLGHLRRNR